MKFEDKQNKYKEKQGKNSYGFKNLLGGGLSGGVLIPVHPWANKAWSLPGPAPAPSLNPLSPNLSYISRLSGSVKTS